MNRNKMALAAAGGAVVALAAGCSGNQSALNPAGQQASDINGLWWFYCIVMTAIYAIVLLLAEIGILRGHGQRTIAEPILHPDQKREKIVTRIVATAVVITVVILFVFMIRDFFTGRAMRALDDPHPLQIQVTGHQWWWEVQYENEVATNIVTTANEIHLPVGKAVEIGLQSADVIHSFWAPNLDGKKDLVPGHPTSFWFRARRTGTFYGQCAEFCGLQHAHMRLVIVVESPKEFQDWLTAQGTLARAPTTDEEKKGQHVFLSYNCVACHTITGTPARGTVGPDLSHLASRQMLAAGTLYNTRGHLAGWILDAQQIKPGVAMPQNTLDPGSLQALLAYLGNLQ